MKKGTFFEVTHLTSPHLTSPHLTSPHLTSSARGCSLLWRLCLFWAMMLGGVTTAGAQTDCAFIVDIESVEDISLCDTEFDVCYTISYRCLEGAEMFFRTIHYDTSFAVVSIPDGATLDICEFQQTQFGVIRLCTYKMALPSFDLGEDPDRPDTVVVGCFRLKVQIDLNNNLEKGLGFDAWSDGYGTSENPEFNKKLAIKYSPRFTNLELTPLTKLSDLIAQGIMPSSGLSPVANPFGAVFGILIDEDLIIDVPFYYFENVEIRLKPGVKILVEENTALSLLGCNLATCPIPGFWGEGIVVESNAVLTVDNSTLSDCRHAISAQAGAYVGLVDNTFRNNYIGLNLDMGSGSAQKLAALVLRDNQFVTDEEENLRPAYPGMLETSGGMGFCGIRANNYLSLNLSQPNRFERLANGVMYINSTGNMDKLSFKDITATDPAYSIRGNGVYLASRNNTHFANVGLPWAPGVTFDNCTVGVYARGYAGGLYRTVMSNVGDGAAHEQCAGTGCAACIAGASRPASSGISARWSVPDTGA